ncbi:hypothetical protein VTJ49DRAFT_1398 [Mycothermus thermophilus]|uniref:Uncharacterized protein n=1 Tax=Humicola insolens TaxID=85995 RepID=A0ABR3VCR1_HUMIN
MACLKLRSGVTSQFDRRATSTVTTLPTFVIASSTLTISVSQCCHSTQPPYSGPNTARETASSITASSSSGTLPVAAIVAITIGTALLFSIGVFLVFACRRRALKRRRATNMFPDASGYRPVARPATPVSQPASPMSTSSLSSQALLDLGFRTEDVALFTAPPKRATPDRSSVDTLFALRFYGLSDTREPEVPPSELPATPPPEPTSAPPPPPVTGPLAPPTPPPSTSPGPLKQRPPAPKRKPAHKRTVYLNPAGEPWVSVPPPSVPLPAPPAVKRSSPGSPDRPRPMFSLFPAPPKTAPRLPNNTPKLQIPTPATTPAATPVPSPQSQTQPVKRNFSRPSPIAILPPTIPLPAPASAPPSGIRHAQSLDSVVSGGTGPTRARAGTHPTTSPDPNYNNCIPHHHHHQKPRSQSHSQSCETPAFRTSPNPSRTRTPKLNLDLDLGKNFAQDLGVGLGLGLALEFPRPSPSPPASSPTPTTTQQQQLYFPPPPGQPAAGTWGSRKSSLQSSLRLWGWGFGSRSPTGGS